MHRDNAVASGQQSEARLAAKRPRCRRDVRRFDCGMASVDSARIGDQIVRPFQRVAGANIHRRLRRRFLRGQHPLGLLAIQRIAVGRRQPRSQPGDHVVHYGTTPTTCRPRQARCDQFHRMPRDGADDPRPAAARRSLAAALVIGRHRAGRVGAFHHPPILAQHHPRARGQTGRPASGCAPVSRVASLCPCWCIPRRRRTPTPNDTPPPGPVHGPLAMPGRAGATTIRLVWLALLPALAPAEALPPAPPAPPVALALADAVLG